MDNSSNNVYILPIRHKVRKGTSPPRNYTAILSIRSEVPRERASTGLPLVLRRRGKPVCRAAGAPVQPPASASLPCSNCALASSKYGSLRGIRVTFLMVPKPTNSGAFKAEARGEPIFRRRYGPCQQRQVRLLGSVALNQQQKTAAGQAAVTTRRATNQAGSSVLEACNALIRFKLEPKRSAASGAAPIHRGAR